MRKDTFEPPVEAPILPPTPSADNSAPGVNGRAVEEQTTSTGTTSRPTELTLRGGKKPEKRSDKSDGPFLLSSNEYYSVAQLPALPEQIRSHSSTKFASVLSPDNGYALALTHSHALIWPYNSPSSVPPSKDTFTFELPFAISTNDPLPIAAFTAKSATKEPGLVIVTPAKGKIAYWETISSASSLVPSPQAQGVQGSIPGMFSGETVSSVVNAEPAGFVLTFSHGRVAHLTLKDQLGRPAIGVQFLRKVSTGSQSSLFGSIRNVFGGSGRKSIAAAHAGKASRGQRDVMVVTGDAEIELWDTRLSVGNSLKYQLNAKETLLDALKFNLPTDGTSEYHFRVLDFAVLTKGSSSTSTGQEVAKSNGDGPETIMFLVSLTHGGQASYFIIESQISSDRVQVKAVHRITCYRKPTNSDAAWQPKLVIPQPASTAFVVFETATVLFSLAKLDESASQLLLEGGSAPEPFQDCIRFQEDTPFRVLSSSVEDKSIGRKHPSVILAIQSFGIVRISDTLGQKGSEDIEEAKVTPKSKIEQAVFFGSLKNNPLDLVSQGEQKFDVADIEAAALEISEEILTSKSKYLPKASPSIEQNLRTRAKTHDDLALHLSKHYNPISRPARWRLLWNAEKLAAQRAIWKTEQEHRKRRPEGEDTILQQIVRYMHPEMKTDIDRTKAENDRVRHWLTFDTNRLENFIPWLHVIHGELYKDEVTDSKVVAENISECIDLMEAIFETAFRFRETNVSLYGLHDETFKHGMLFTGYTGLDLPWTSDFHTFVIEFVNMTSDFARKWWVNDSKSTAESPNPATIRKIGSSLPQQTEILSHMLLEKGQWCKARPEEEMHEEGVLIHKEHIQNSRQHLLSMAGLGFSNEAIALAEKLGDMEMLVELSIDAIVQLSEQMQAQQTEKEAERFEREVEKANDRMDSYFNRFGDRWARAYYERLIQDGQLGSLLNDEKNQQFLTRYLRKNAAYSKISWINDIVGEHSFSKAAETLAFVATEQEIDLWSKKVELSLSKLATLAAAESKAKSTKKEASLDAKQDLHVSETTSLISLIDLQTRLHLHVTSLIGRNVLDFSSRLDLAFEILGKNSPAVKGKPAFKGLLYDGLGILLREQSMTVDQIVDVLTLMSPVGSDPDNQDKITDETIDAGVVGNEFFFALKAVEFALPQPSDGNETDTLDKRTKRDALQKIIWRRVMIRDDWESLNRTDNKSEQDVTDSMRGTILWTTASQVFEQDLLASSSTHSNKQPSTTTSIPYPSQIISSNLFPPTLSSRFKPQELDLVRKDLDAENQDLESSIKKGRLDTWFPGVLRDVKIEVFDLEEERGDEEMAVATTEADTAETGDGENSIAGEQQLVQEEEQLHDDVEMQDEATNPQVDSHVEAPPPEAEPTTKPQQQEKRKKRTTRRGAASKSTTTTTTTTTVDSAVKQEENEAEDQEPTKSIEAEPEDLRRSTRASTRSSKRRSVRFASANPGAGAGVEGSSK